MKSVFRFAMVGFILCVFPMSAMGIEYYLPYCTSSDTQATGMAVRNLSTTDEALVTITTYNQGGTVVETLNRTIPADGQDYFVAAAGITVEGWIQVSSDQPLGGLCGIGKIGTENYVADIPFESQSSYLLYVPHVAQNSTWDSFIMACNPNSTGATLTATIVDQSGATVASQSFQLGAHGSLDISVDSLTSAQVSGSVRLSSTQPIAGFVLYNNLKTGGYSYAGINAVNPLNENGGWVLYDDFNGGSIDPAKWNIDDSSAVISLENGAVKFIHQSGFPNDSSWIWFPDPTKILAVKATFRVSNCSGDVRCRIGGNLLEDTTGNFIWQNMQVKRSDSEIQAYVGAYDQNWSGEVYKLHANQFENPIAIDGSDITLSTVFRLPTFMFRADGYGEATFKPEMMLGESGAADQFLGIGTRSSNGDGPCTLYVDDVYVIYKD